MSAPIRRNVDPPPLRRRGKKLRELPSDVAERERRLPAYLQRGALDVAIARYRVDRCTLAELIVELVKVENEITR